MGGEVGGGGGGGWWCGEVVVQGCHGLSFGQETGMWGQILAFIDYTKTSQFFAVIMDLNLQPV